MEICRFTSYHFEEGYSLIIHIDVTFTSAATSHLFRKAERLSRMLNFISVPF